MSTTEAATAKSTKAKPKAEVEKVKMSDGREVEFAGKRKMLKEAIYADGQWIGTRFDFRNGETRTFDAPAQDIKTPDEGIFLFHKLAGHGSEQKIGDETAGAESIGDMIDAVDAVIDRLSKGEWYMEGVGAGAAGTSILLRAL